MKKRFAAIVFALALTIVWTPSTQVEAKAGTCEDGTLIYEHVQQYWICMGYVTAGQSCILCHGEPIDVVG